MIILNHSLKFLKITFLHWHINISYNIHFYFIIIIIIILYMCYYKILTFKVKDI